MSFYKMMMRLLQNQWAKVKIAFLSSSLADHCERLLYFTTILLLPTQLGKHFWPQFSILLGRKIDYLSPTIYVTDAVILLLFILWSKKHFRQTARMLFSRGWIVVFVSLLVLSSLFAMSLIASLYGVLKIAEFSFFAYYTAVCVGKMKQLLGSLFLIGIIFEAVLAGLQFFFHGSIDGVFYWVGERSFTSNTPGIANASIDGTLQLRPYGTFPHPNVLAAYLLLALFIIVEWKLIPSLKSGKVRVLSLLGAGIGLVALFLTLSRVVILLSLVYLLARSVVFFWNAKGLQKTITLLAVFLFVLFNVFFFLRFGGRFITLATDSSFRERVDLVIHATTVLFQYPLLGVGLNNYLFHLADARMLAGGIPILQPVHNIFLLLAVQLGVPCFVLVLMFIKRTAKRAKLLAHDGDMLPLLLLVAVLVLGFIDHYFFTLQQGQLLLALVFGICWQKRLYETRVEKKKDFATPTMKKSSKKHTKRLSF